MHVISSYRRDLRKRTAKAGLGKQGHSLSSHRNISKDYFHIHDDINSENADPTFRRKVSCYIIMSNGSI